jgi:hypothetical protein
MPPNPLIVVLNGFVRHQSLFRECCPYRRAAVVLNLSVRAVGIRGVVESGGRAREDQTESRYCEESTRCHDARKRELRE